MDEQLLTTKQVAFILNLQPVTIRRWIESGHLAAIRLPSGEYRVRQSEVDRVLGSAA
jgi:excisionase family DNA binding protein